MYTNTVICFFFPIPCLVYLYSVWLGKGRAKIRYKMTPCRVCVRIWVDTLLGMDRGKLNFQWIKCNATISSTGKGGGGIFFNCSSLGALGWDSEATAGKKFINKSVAVVHHLQRRDVALVLIATVELKYAFVCVYIQTIEWEITVQVINWHHTLQLIEH